MKVMWFKSNNDLIIKCPSCDYTLTMRDINRPDKGRAFNTVVFEYMTHKECSHNMELCDDERQSLATIKRKYAFPDNNEQRGPMPVVASVVR